MSRKITEKMVRSMNGTHLSFGYNEISFLLMSQPVFGHTEGVYGWNFNCFDINHNNDSVVISTGYRRMIGHRVNAALSKEYNNKAYEIYNTPCMTTAEYDAKIASINHLLHEYLDKALATVLD